MATHINLFNHEWCELVFVNRNHSYGAFEIRETNAKRHLIAVVITLSITTLIVAMPSLLKKDLKVIDIKDDRVVVLSDLPPTKAEPEKIKDFLKPKQEIQKQVRSMIDATIPKIVKDSDVKPGDVILTNDSLYKADADIGNKNIKGDPTSIYSYADFEPEKKEPEIVEFVEQMPRFPGGEEALFKFLKKNLEYPRVPLENNVQGTVYVRFVVFESGEIGNVEIARGFDADCEKEAVRVIKRMEKWLPGKQNGNAVNVRMSIPVKFKITDIR